MRTIARGAIAAQFALRDPGGEWGHFRAAGVRTRRASRAAIQNGWVASGHLVLGAIESSVLNRFRHLGIGDAVHPRKVRNRARDLENAMIPAR